MTLEQLKQKADNLDLNVSVSIGTHCYIPNAQKTFDSLMTVLESKKTPKEKRAAASYFNLAQKIIEKISEK